MPAIFGLGKIGYWQGFGLVLMGRLLFGTFGHHPRHGRRFGHHRRHNWHWDEEEWKIGGSWRNWDHYDDWWHEEGRAAFARYVEKKNGNGKDDEEAGG